MNEENYSVRWQDSHGNAPGYEEKPTPTPWDYSGEFVKTSDNKTVIAEVMTGDDICHDSELIVRAVNSHEALLEAAKSALDILPHVVKFLKFQQPGHEFWPNREAGEAAILKLESAIAKAEVRP